MRLGKFRFPSFANTFAVLLMVCLCAPAAMQAGTVILEGSDAIGYHCRGGGNAAACAYTAQVWKALAGSSGKPIAVIGDTTSGITSQGSGITINTFSSVAAAGTLSQYAALYFEAGGGCCTENDLLITASGATAAVTAYLNGGGTVMIENYVGNAAWDFAVGAGGLGNANETSTGCSDGETVTATGLTNGFTQPAPMGCWEHQAYLMSFFAGRTSINGQGFTLSFFNAPSGFPGYSGLLSNGNTLTGGAPSTTPLPPTILLILVGLAAIGVFFAARRKFARAV